MRRAALLLALCLTQADLNDAVCRALCRQDGYDEGRFKNQKCLCSNEIEFEVFTEKTIFIKTKKTKIEAPYSPSVP